MPSSSAGAGRFAARRVCCFHNTTVLRSAFWLTFGLRRAAYHILRRKNSRENTDWRQYFCGPLAGFPCAGPATAWPQDSPQAGAILSSVAFFGADVGQVAHDELVRQARERPKLLGLSDREWEQTGYHMAVQPSLPHCCDPARIFMVLMPLQATDPSNKPTLPPKLPMSAEV
jgi:hypothetical protein